MSISLRVDFQFKETEEFEKIFQILGFRSKLIKILDKKDDLLLLHYDESKIFSLPQIEDSVLSIRGTVIDMKREIIICPSFGYTSFAIKNKIEFDQEGKISFINNIGKNLTFDKDDIIISKAYEGFVIRAIWYDNKPYFFSYKKLDPSKSFWGKSDYFLDAYYNAGGPKHEEMFDTTKPFSSTCYFFLVSTSEVLVGSKINLEHPFVVLLDTVNLDLKGIDQSLIAPGTFNFEIFYKIPERFNQPMVIGKEELTLEKGNEFLEKGFYSSLEVDQIDIRRNFGEAIYICKKSDPKYHILVKSDSYNWRCEIRNEKASVRLALYNLISLGKRMLIRSSLLEFKKKFLAVPIRDTSYIESKIKERGYLIWKDLLLEDKDKESIKKMIKKPNEMKEELEKFVFLNLIFSLPPSLQRTYYRLYDEYKEQLVLIRKFIFSLTFRENPIISKRKAKNEITSFFNELQSIYGDIKKMKKKILKERISSRIENMEGNSLHSILTLALKEKNTKEVKK